jgi:hypothetical protein
LSPLFISNIYVYAGGPRLDNDERYADIPGAGECWVDGWDDGAVGKYSEDRASECVDKGDQYNVAHNDATRICIEQNGEGRAGDCEYSQNLKENDNDD